jgi:hypothetical protein
MDRINKEAGAMKLVAPQVLHGFFSKPPRLLVIYPCFCGNMNQGIPLRFFWFVESH